MPGVAANQYAVLDCDSQTDGAARAKADRYARVRSHGDADRHGNHYSHSGRFANAVRI